MPVIILTMLAIIVALGIIVKKIFSSESIDNFANDLCDLNPKKSTKSLCKEGENVFDALDKRVEENDKAKKELEGENESIRSFSRKVSVNAELNEMEREIENKHNKQTK